MKKIAFCLLVLLGLLRVGAGAEGFSWADYEKICWEYGKEPSWEEYQYLIENPQCYGEDIPLEELEGLHE